MGYFVNYFMIFIHCWKRKDFDRKQINGFLRALIYAFDSRLVSIVYYVIHSIIVYHQRKWRGNTIAV